MNWSVGVLGLEPITPPLQYSNAYAEGMGGESIWKDLKGQIYLGDDDFVDQMRGKLGKRDEDVNIARVQQRAPAPMLSAIRRRYSNRDEGIRAAYETGAYSYQEIAAHFEVHFTTVGRIVRSSAQPTATVRARQ